MSYMSEWAKNEVEIACKREAPDRKDGAWDYYEAVIAIANSDDMLSGSKCEAIARL